MHVYSISLCTMQISFQNAFHEVNRVERDVVGYTPCGTQGLARRIDASPSPVHWTSPIMTSPCPLQHPWSETGKLHWIGKLHHGTRGCETMQLIWFYFLHTKIGMKGFIRFLPSLLSTTLYLPFLGGGEGKVWSLQHVHNYIIFLLAVIVSNQHLLAHLVTVSGPPNSVSRNAVFGRPVIWLRYFNAGITWATRSFLFPQKRRRHRTMFVASPGVVTPIRTSATGAKRSKGQHSFGGAIVFWSSILVWLATPSKRR
jgi:hypothetical protein